MKLKLLTLLLLPVATSHALDVQPLLDAGDFGGAKAELRAALKADPGDGDVRLALGVTTFLSGIEEFAQTIFAHGLRGDMGGPLGGFVPLRIPARFNPEPLETSADDVVTMLERMEDAMSEVDTILEPLGDTEANFDLRIGTVKMDLNGDGDYTDDEGLWRLFNAVTNPRNRRGRNNAGEPEMPESAETFVLGLDTADGYWLRGYCNVFGAVADMVLAYDGTELFERTGHLYFHNVDSPYPWLGLPARGGRFDSGSMFDLVAALHLINQPLRDANRMADAHAHLLQVIELSRLNWASIRAETDNANEWLPGPGQTGVIGVDINEEQVASWLAMLDELEKILKGELLVPFWRGAGEVLLDEDGEWRDDADTIEVGNTHPRLGVNVQKVFMEPTDFDLLLWIQGTAAAPYLEEGPRTQGRFWNRMNEAFGRNFPGFAVWIN